MLWVSPSKILYAATRNLGALILSRTPPGLTMHIKFRPSMIPPPGICRSFTKRPPAAVGPIMNAIAGLSRELDRCADQGQPHPQQ